MSRSLFGQFLSPVRNIVAAVAALTLSATALPGAANAQLFYTQPPSIERGPIEPGDPLIGLPLPGANAADQRAALLWNFRVALNVAALQCQFSRYLRSVDIYNAFIDHHSVELLAAFRALDAHFRRISGARGQREFDSWSTRTYNGFTSLQGQVSFCQTAGEAGRAALAARKGQLLAVAQVHMRALRTALRPARDSISPPVAPYLSPLPSTLFGGNPCEGLRGSEARRCQRENR